jgi:hypothetical protein
VKQAPSVPKVCDLITYSAILAALGARLAVAAVGLTGARDKLYGIRAAELEGFGGSRRGEGKEDRGREKDYGRRQKHDEYDEKMILYN